MKTFKKIIKVFLILLIVGISSIVFLFYGPFERPREIWITTAMSTYSHQYLATWFFSEETINKIVSNNSIKDTNEKTDIASINLDSSSSDEFATVPASAPVANQESPVDNSLSNEYSTLKHVDGTGFKGYLITINDPSKVKVDITNNLGERGIKIKDYIKTHKIVAAINGGGFQDDGGHGHGGTPLGVIIKNEELIYAEEKPSFNFIGFNKDNVLISGNYSLKEIQEMNIRDGVTYFCRLIVNGKPLISEDGAGSGIQPRSAIGQTKDGKILMLVIDGRQLHSIGATLKQVQDIMLEHGAYNAVNLDGGSSSVMYYKDELVSKPSSQYGERFLPSIFIVE